MSKELNTNLSTWEWTCECDECVGGFATREAALREHALHANNRVGHDLVDLGRIG